MFSIIVIQYIFIYISSDFLFPGSPLPESPISTLLPSLPPSTLSQVPFSCPLLPVPCHRAVKEAQVCHPSAFPGFPLKNCKIWLFWLGQSLLVPSLPSSSIRDSMPDSSWYRDQQIDIVSVSLKYQTDIDLTTSFLFLYFAFFHGTHLLWSLFFWLYRRFLNFREAHLCFPEHISNLTHIIFNVLGLLIYVLKCVVFFWSILDLNLCAFYSFGIILMCSQR